MKTSFLLKLKSHKKMGVLFLSVLFTMLFRSIQAQNIIISGSINTSTNRQIIAGASVQIKGTTTGTLSDAKGNFKISAPKSATLIIRSVGFTTKEVLVDNKTNIEVLLDEDVKSIEEVVVVGYGTQKKSDVTGSIVSIKSETIEKLSFTDAAQAIQGLAPGVSVESQSGAPGASINVKIRGTGSLGNTNPLYVVDGLPVNDLSNVSSSDIASIEILKDASASAIYGTRASNGVVLVTTKRGKEGQTLISFNARYGFQNLNKKMPITDINGRLYAQALSDRFNRGNQIGLFTPMDVAVQNAILNNTDWQNELFNNGAPQQEYSLNMSKGTAVGSYSVNANYTSKAGIMKGSDYDRYTIRFNSDFKKSIFTFTQNFQVYRSFQNLKFGWQNAFSTVRLAPWVPAYGDASNPTGINESKYPNPLQLAESTENNTTQNGIQGAFAINAQVTPWLAIKGKIGSRFESSAFRNYSGPYNFGQASKVTSELTETNTNSEYLLGEIFAEFKKTYGNHDINFLIGYTSESWKTKFQRLYGEGFLNKDIREMSAATKNRDASGSLTNTKILSKIARISYGYNNKYNIQASFRQDGSSRFGPGKRYGDFYSISGAWKINNENFMKSVPIFSELKLRGGYGVIGNSSNSDYLYYSSVNPNATYIFGSTSTPGAALAGVVDPNLHWEQTQETNLGIDWSILSNKVYGSIDAYNRFTKDVLASIPIALSAGSDRDLFTNLASLRNKGVEFLVGYRNNEGKIQYNINANLGLLKNEVVSLGGANPIYGGQPINDGQHDRVSLTKEGGSVGDFWLIPTSGIVKSNEQLAAYQKLVPAAKLGDLIYQDTNGDGKLDDNDRLNLGSPIPKYEFGLNLNANYKNFDVSLFLAGQAGHKIYNAFKYAAIWAGAHYDNILSWTPANPASNIPRMDENNAHNNTRAISDRYLESGDYLRIKNLQVGYTFPDKVFGKTGISKLRIYLSSQNLWTFTKYSSFDPEAGNDGLFNRGVDQGLYPQGRLFQAGLNLNF